MAVDDLGNALCYHPLGSGRAGFASRRRLDLYQVLETGFTSARHEPAIGATTATRLVGLRRSLASLLFEHDLFGKPVSTFPDHALGPIVNPPAREPWTAVAASAIPRGTM